jgi:hypothetical protein
MTTELQTSGQISMSQINSYFSLGTNLSPYLGTTYWSRYPGATDSNYVWDVLQVTGTFNSSNLKMSDFYGKRKNQGFTITYPALTHNGTPFTWSIKNASANEYIQVWAMVPGGGSFHIAQSDNVFIQCDSSGSFSNSLGDWSPSTGSADTYFKRADGTTYILGIFVYAS